MHYGLDISSHDNPPESQPPDFAAAYQDLKARGGGAEPFLLIKATEGTSYTNPDYAPNLAAAIAAGWKAIGAYHFFHPASSVTAQIGHFRAVAGPLPAMLDDETSDGLDWTTVSQAVNAWLTNSSEINDLHYVNGNFHNNETGVVARPLMWPLASGPAPAGTVITQTQGDVAGFAPGRDIDTWTGTEQQFLTFFQLQGAPHMPSNPIPVSVAYAAICSTGGVTGDGSPNRLDLLFVGNDGKAYHKWFIGGQGWFGPDIVTGPV